MEPRTTAGILRLAGTPNLKTPLNLENLDMLEYPFLTLCKYPTGFILQLGSTVCARSVKLLERVPNPEEPETRDFWWTELRMEIRSHVRFSILPFTFFKMLPPTYHVNCRLVLLGVMSFWAIRKSRAFRKY